MGLTVLATVVESAPTLWSTLPVPPEKVPVRVVLLPAVMVAVAGTKLLMAGAATTATVVVAVLVPSACGGASHGDRPIRQAHLPDRVVRV